MDYIKLIASGKSVRDYKKKTVNDTLLHELKSYAKSNQRLVNDISVDVEILDNAQVFQKLDGIAGYKGHMIDAPHYIIVFSENKPHYIENAGYMGEDIILKANDLGIDSCWITFSDSENIKSALEITSSKEVTGLIALGYGVGVEKKVINPTKIGENSSKSQIDVVQASTSHRISVEEIVFMEKWGNAASATDLEERGLLDAFLYANMAPSTLNRQPWRYIINGGVIIFALRKDENISEYEEKIDSGISMLFFKAVIDATLFNLNWDLNVTGKDELVPNNYKVVAICNV